MASIAWVVEHSQGTALFVAQELESQGWTCLLWPPAHHLGGLLQHGSPDLLILDDDSPRGNASYLRRTLKLRPDTYHIPILLVQPRPGLSQPLCCVEIEPDLELELPSPRERVRAALTELQGRRQLAQKGINELRCRIPSDTGHLEELLRDLGPVLVSSGLGFDQMKRLLLAVREMGTNAIEWGHRKQFETPVHLSCRLEPERICFTIRDNGPGFDPLQLPHAAMPGNPVAHVVIREAQGLREGGFGILMTRGLVDEMSYNSTGNEVRLVMFLRRDSEPGVAASS